MATRSRKSSQIWGYFSDTGDNKAKCNFCSRVISFKGGNLFNLNRHVRIMHPTVCLSTQRLTPSRPDSPDPDDLEIVATSSNPTINSINTMTTTTTKSTSSAALQPRGYIVKAQFPHIFQNPCQTENTKS